jgi:hypothetical protein
MSSCRACSATDPSARGRDAPYRRSPARQVVLFLLLLRLLPLGARPTEARRDRMTCRAPSRVSTSTRPRSWFRGRNRIVHKRYRRGCSCWCRSDSGPTGTIRTDQPLDGPLSAAKGSREECPARARRYGVRWRSSTPRISYQPGDCDGEGDDEPTPTPIES